MKPIPLYRASKLLNLSNVYSQLHIRPCYESKSDCCEIYGHTNDKFLSTDLKLLVLHFAVVLIILILE